MVCIKPNTLTVRVFSEGAGWGEPYKAVATVQLLSDNSAYVSGLMGEINRKDYLNLMRKLREEYGVRDVRWHRARPGDLNEDQQTTSAPQLVSCGIADIS